GCEIARAVRRLKVVREVWERELPGENGVFVVFGVSGGLEADFQLVRSVLADLNWRFFCFPTTGKL
ncbi:MAG TPA: hypothetical protein VLA84_00415, partial [Microcoleus sp.]|nr:hypothetical protein [Microcoleus sp.]